MKDHLDKILSSYNHFQECIIEDIKFDHYGSEVKIEFHYIYDDEGFIKTEPMRLVCLHFYKVREFRMVNDWNESQLREMEKLNWGANEIAIIRMEYLEKTTIAHLCWESDRRIDIEFETLQIFEKNDSA